MFYVNTCSFLLAFFPKYYRVTNYRVKGTTEIGHFVKLERQELVLKLYIMISLIKIALTQHILAKT